MFKKLITLFPRYNILYEVGRTTIESHIERIHYLINYYLIH